MKRTSIFNVHRQKLIVKYLRGLYILLAWKFWRGNLLIPNQKCPPLHRSLHVVYLFLVRCAYNDPKPWLPPPPLSKDPVETLIVEDTEEDRARSIVDLTAIDSESFEVLVADNLYCLFYSSLDFSLPKG